MIRLVPLAVRVVVWGAAFVFIHRCRCDPVLVFIRVRHPDTDPCGDPPDGRCGVPCTLDDCAQREAPISRKGRLHATNHRRDQ